MILEQLCFLSCNIDDMTPEEVSYAADLLREYALDVNLESIAMKKGRLAFRLEVLCSLAMKKTVLRAMFKETSTIGIKEEQILRYSLKREFEKVDTKNGMFTVKKVFLDEEFLKQKVEFDERSEFAKAHGLSILDVRV